MEDGHYPTIDEDFLLDLIIKSPKIDPESHINVGSSHTFNLKGDKPIYKRHINIRSKDGQFTYLDATGKAIVLGFMTELLKWLEKNRNWKDGAYFIPEVE